MVTARFFLSDYASTLFIFEIKRSGLETKLSEYSDGTD